MELTVAEKLKREKHNAAVRRWRRNHPEEAKAKVYAYLKEHPEKKKAYDRKNALTNRPRVYRNHLAWRNRNKEKLKEVSRKYSQKLKDDVFIAYGGYTCKCCGEDRKEFLSIDHINGGGGKHKKEHRGHLYQFLRNNKFPDGYRILCHNCNMSRGLYGYCPHEKENQQKPA
jgi:hypothetical protein